MVTPQANRWRRNYGARRSGPAATRNSLARANLPGDLASEVRPVAWTRLAILQFLLRSHSAIVIDCDLRPRLAADDTGLHGHYHLLDRPNQTRLKLVPRVRAGGA